MCVAIASAVFDKHGAHMCSIIAVGMGLVNMTDKLFGYNNSTVRRFQ